MDDEKLVLSGVLGEGSDSSGLDTLKLRDFRLLLDWIFRR